MAVSGIRAVLIILITRVINYFQFRKSLSKIEDFINVENENNLWIALLKRFLRKKPRMMS